MNDGRAVAITEEVSETNKRDLLVETCFVEEVLAEILVEAEDRLVTVTFDEGKLDGKAFDETDVFHTLVT